MSDKMPPLVLQQLLIDSQLPWQIHNCKLSDNRVCQHLPLPFLYHYDQLDAAVRAEHPMTRDLLTRFNEPMTATQAAQLLGIDANLIANPWHVKISGSLVVYCQPLHLAVRLQFSNTSKDSAAIYCQSADEARQLAMANWLFMGRVDVLSQQRPFISIDGDGDELILAASTAYQQLPATHAGSCLHALQTHIARLPWFDAAIQTRVL